MAKYWDVENFKFLKNWSRRSSTPCVYLSIHLYQYLKKKLGVFLKSNLASKTKKSSSAQQRQIQVIFKGALDRRILGYRERANKQDLEVEILARHPV